MTAFRAIGRIGLCLASLAGSNFGGAITLRAVPVAASPVTVQGAPCFLREATPGAPVPTGLPDMLCLPASPGPVMIDGDLCQILGHRPQGTDREYVDLSCAPDSRRVELDIVHNSDGRMLVAARPLGESRWYRPVTGK